MWVDARGRVRHDLTPAELSNDLAGRLADLGLEYRLSDRSVPKRVAIFASKSDNCLLDLLWRAAPRARARASAGERAAGRQNAMCLPRHDRSSAASGACP